VRTETLPEIPKNLDAERQILAACLFSDAERGRVFEQLRPDDFTGEAFREVFRVMLELESSHQEISVFTLQNSLGASRAVQDAGGVPFLSTLLDSKAWGSVETQCRIIQQESLRRKMQALGYATEAVALDRSKSVLDIVSDVEERFSEIRDAYLSTSRSAVHVSQVVKELQPALDRAWNGHGALLGISTGYPALDRVVPGFEPGAMIVLAARPSEGKSALGLEFARRSALSGHSVAFFSLEMNRDSLFMRMACRDARVAYKSFSEGKMSADARSALMASIGRISELPIYIDDRGAVAATELRWRLRSLAQRHKIRLAIVDYMQLLRAKGNDRFTQVTAISQELRAAAKELGQLSGGTLIAISQLNRMATKERPGLYHLRESGQIEQDADVVLLLSNEGEAVPGQASPSVKVLDIAKQRNGPTEDIRLGYIPQFMGFEDY
jgi:replicative DNA helicase